MIAAYLRWTDQVDVVWFVPAFEHAFGKALAPWEQRVHALKALAALVGAEVSTVESTLPRPSYTIRTLLALQEQSPSTEFRLVMGADVHAQLPLWRDHERILAEFNPIVVGREGYAPVAGAPSFPAVSSTEIRERLARGDSVDALVPRVVLDAWRQSAGSSS
jgi:nicotinate-nucleotide adenylyltransferase